MRNCIWVFATSEQGVCCGLNGALVLVEPGLQMAMPDACLRLPVTYYTQVMWILSLAVTALAKLPG